MATGSAQQDNGPDSYLKNYAVDDELQRRCKTYLVVNEEEYREGRLEILGYFSISISVFDPHLFSETVEKLLIGDKAGRPSGKYAPAYLITQIACSDKTTRAVFSGASLLDFAEDTVERASELAGGNIIYLQCCDELIGYYQRLGYTHMISEDDVSAPNIMVKLITLDILEDSLCADMLGDEAPSDA